MVFRMGGVVEEVSETLEVDNIWYVAILSFPGGRVYSFTGTGSESYHDFAGTAARRGATVVAEQFGVTDDAIDRITGFVGKERVDERNVLRQLVDKINSGEPFDVGDALARLCVGE